MRLPDDLAAIRSRSAMMSLVNSTISRCDKRHNKRDGHGDDAFGSEDQRHSYAGYDFTVREMVELTKLIIADLERIAARSSGSRIASLQLIADTIRRRANYRWVGL